MALKKSELYSSLWSSCDELRGGMDASQYKDYVLVLLFIKYVSDKYAGAALRADHDPARAPASRTWSRSRASPTSATRSTRRSSPRWPMPTSCPTCRTSTTPTKLGSGKEMVDRLTNLIAIFENPALDFSKNRAEGDDILGDAYEYLMRHFATESGKSKGQFYTPAEVSRIMAQIIGIRDAKTSAATTVYDPTCGSGSLLLKVGDEAGTAVTLYGQEKDAATSGLARMNMILHNNPTALIVQGNTLTDPKFKDGDTLKTFDYVVANPPFSRQALEHRPRSAATTPTSASSPSARRPPSRATTPTCCTSSARSRAPAKARASCRTACCSAAMPRPTSAATSSARATSRASSACPPTSSTAPASPPASSSSTRRTPTPARASS